MLLVYAALDIFLHQFHPLFVTLQKKNVKKGTEILSFFTYYYYVSILYSGYLIHIMKKKMKINPGK